MGRVIWKWLRHWPSTGTPAGFGANVSCSWERRRCGGSLRAEGANKDGPRQQRIVAATLERKPKAATHWSTRTLAKDQGVSHSTVRRVLQAHQRKPHLEKTFKVSRDPKFLEKLTDVVGLYLNPPQQALVLCVDEPSGAR